MTGANAVPARWKVLELDALEGDAFVSALGHLFEHSPWVAAETYRHGPFRTATRLLASLRSTLAAAPQERQIELLRAHPDLAGRMLRAVDLTAESQREQAGAGLDAMSGEEAAELQRLNSSYRDRFGFPFVICARLNDRGSILSALRRRLKNPAGAEIEAALDEVGKIAALRLRDALDEGEPLEV
jgi:2-oxo-4-hydroxy-4-carboxy-5-ureidoimidazoline decarboxylase